VSDPHGESESPPFEELDFLYMPSSDVESDMAFFTEVLGGRVVFAVEGMGARVAAVELASSPPTILLTDHLEGEQPILVYRVQDLEAALNRQGRAGWTRERSFEIPHGPCCSFRTPGGHRLALYEMTRPEAATHFNGRRDF
jgi:predicted enzyme related to lactoylglutathione lyase